MDVNDLALRNEGVDFRVVDQDDLDAFRVKAGSFDQWIADILEQQFGFAVAEQRLRRGGLRSRKEQHQTQHHELDQAG